MGTNTKISWAHHTWNPWRGCQHASLLDGTQHPGCANCYAEAMAKRNPGTLGVWGLEGTRVMAVEKTFEAPLKWNHQQQVALDCYERWATAGFGPWEHPIPEDNRPRVFVNSLCDVFEDWAGPISDHHGRQLFTINGEEAFTEAEYPECRELTMDDLRRRLFSIIDQCPHLDFLILTKRPENIRKMWPDYSYHACVSGDCPHWNKDECDPHTGYRENVWLLTSVSNLQTANLMIPHLLKCRDLVPVLGVSLEPMLGEVDLGLSITTCDCCERWDSRWVELSEDVHGDWPIGHTTVAKAGIYRASSNKHGALSVTAENGQLLGIKPGEFRTLGKLDLIITGCESNGRKVGRLGEFTSEAAFIEGVRSINQQCQAAGVAHFVKQLPMGGMVSHDPAEWPEDLRIQQMPGVTV